MSGGRRLLLVVALAALAVVPLRAFGVVGGGAGGLAVSASLGGCGVAGDGIACQIDVTYAGVEGADRYTASVTLPDGSVQDAGAVGSGEGGGSASISVPYVGSGTYTVTVSAWGGDEEEGEKPELLDREESGAREDRDRGETAPEADDPEAQEAGTEDASAPGEDAAAAPEGEPAEPQPQTLPECRADTAEAADPAASEPAAEAGGELEASAAPPESPPAPAVECTTPSTDSNGPCCPPSA